MKVRQPLRLILVVAAIGIALAACGTDEQTLAPSASPSTVQASPNPRLVEFETHLVASMAKEGQLIRALASASAGSNAELHFVATDLGTWADDEATWLDEHPADPCFVDAWDDYRMGLAKVASSAAAFVALAAHPSPPTDAEGQAAGNDLADGSEAIERAAALARASRAVCS